MLQPANRGVLYRILVLIIVFGEAVADSVLSLYFRDASASFGLCIIAAEYFHCSVVTHEILQIFREFTFLFKAINVNIPGGQSIINLCAYVIIV